jgi:hypothetical protein
LRLFVNKIDIIRDKKLSTTDAYGLSIYKILLKVDNKPISDIIGYR